MRIGVVGKGGGGKTTLSWLLIQAARQHGWQVVGLDADFNQHLAPMLGLTLADVPGLADNREAVIGHLLGQRTDIKPADFTRHTQPVAQSQLIQLTSSDPFIQRFSGCINGVQVLRVGEYQPEDRGEKCYHGRTAVADMVLNHLAPLPPQTVLITDFTAGVDPFASPIYAKFDYLILVVEPTLKGAEVVRQWRALLADKDIPLYPVANKVSGPEDVAWLENALQLKLAATLLVDPALRRAERGDEIGWTNLLPANQQALQSLFTTLQSQTVKVGA